MDSSHVSLVALLLRADGFDHFRVDKNLAVSEPAFDASSLLFY